MWVFRETKAKVWDDSTGALWVHSVLLVFWIILITRDLQQPSYLNSYSVYKPTQGWREDTSTNVISILLYSMLKRGVGGFWFLSSNFEETWCYAVSWCAMFVLYTGSGEMLLLTTDSGMDWLWVVFFCRLSHVIMTWRRGGTDDVTLSSLGCWWGQWRQQWMLLDVVMHKTFWWI